jgi:hypothetical protein
MYPMSSRHDRVSGFCAGERYAPGYMRRAYMPCRSMRTPGVHAPGVRMRREYVPQPGDACAGVRMRREYVCAPEYVRRAPGA